MRVPLAASMAFGVWVLGDTPLAAQMDIEQFGTTAYDEAVSVVVRDGFVYIGGNTWGVLSTDVVAAQVQDVFIRRTDNIFPTNQGTYTQFQSLGDDTLKGLALDKDGGLYAVGRTKGDLALQKEELAPAAGETEAWVRRYAFKPSGTFKPKWSWEVKTPFNDEMLAVALHPATGKLLVAGATQGDLVNGIIPTYDHDEDAFVRVYDSRTGKKKTTVEFGTDKIEEIFSVVVSDRSVFIAGMTRGDLTTLFPNHFGADLDGNQNDAFVARLDPATLAVDWIYQFGSNGRSDAAQDVALTTGALFVVGRHGQDDSAYANCTGRETEDLNDAFVMRIDLDTADQPTGVNGGLDVEGWLHVTGTCDGDQAAAVVVGNGHVYAVGATGGGVDHEVPADTEDGFLWEYELDYAGLPVQTRIFTITSSGTKSDRVNDVAWDGTKLHMVGVTDGVLAGSKIGDADAFWAQFTP